MATSAQLGIKVTNDGVDETRRKLNKLDKQSKSNEKTNDSLKSSFVELGRDAASGIALIDGPLGGASSRVSALTGLLGSTSSALGLFGAAAGAAAAGVTALTLAQADAVREASNLARVSGISISELAASGFAAKQYGLDVKSLSDSFKDAKERVGDFIATGGGPFQDYADVMNLTADEAAGLASELKDLSGQQVLQTLVSNMQEAGASTDEMSFALEGMASDLTYILPLLIDNGAELERLQNKFSEISSPLTEQEVQAYRDLAENADLATASISNLAQKGLAPLASILSQSATGVARFFGILSDSLEDSTAPEDFDKALDLLFQIGDLQAELAETDSVVASRGIQAKIDSLTAEREALLGNAAVKAEAANKEIEETYKAIEAQKESSESSETAAQSRIRLASEEAAAAKAALEAAKALAANNAAASRESGYDVDTSATNLSAGIIVGEESTIEKLERQRSLIQSYQELEIGDMQAHQEALMILDAQIAEERYANAQEYQDKMKELRAEQNELISAYGSLSGSISGAFGEIANAISNSGEEASTAYATMFALSKGFATAQATLNLWLAASQALAMPDDVTLADKIASYTSVLSAATGVVSSISGISYSGRLQGGSTNPGGTYVVGERGPELVTFGREGGSVQSNTQMQSQQGRASNKTNYTVVNQTSGRVDQVEQQQVSESDVVLILRETMPGEIANANSTTSKAMTKNTSVKRKLR